jgi:SAM-dependent methyltransferase
MTARRTLLPSDDVHLLYQAAVQAPEFEARFLDRLYRRLTGHAATLLREDFCGTALLACTWVGMGPRRRAIGVDIEQATLDWAARNNLAALAPAERARIQLVRSDVLHLRRPLADLVVALNFSYSVLKTRALLQAYARNARRSLRPGGLLVLDAWGGSMTQAPRQDRKRLRGCTYVWDQVSFDPISHHTDCRIHFEFPDGSARRNAFTYDWRLWTLPELREILGEAGFEDVHVLWEATDGKTNKGNGRFRRVARAPADPSWVSYLVGRAPGAK